MKRRLITWVIMLCLLAGNAQAVRPAGEDPFININVTPSTLNLGNIPFVGTEDSSAKLTVQVESNCTHGPIMISATDFERPEGGSIPPKNIFVKSSATKGFVTMEKPVAISKTNVGSHDIELNFRLQSINGKLEPAGKYKGKFIFTVIPPLP